MFVSIILVPIAGMLLPVTHLPVTQPRWLFKVWINAHCCLKAQLTQLELATRLQEYNSLQPPTA